jgi:hypothetical protein
LIERRPPPESDWMHGPGRGILRTPEIVGRRLSRDGGLRVAAARGAPRRRRSPELWRAAAEGRPRICRRGSAAGGGALQFAGAPSSTAAVLLLPPPLSGSRPWRWSAARVEDWRRRGLLPRPGVLGGGSRLWRPNPARQGGPRQVTMGRVDLYIHTHSVLHLSHVRLGALSRSWAVPTVTGPGGTGRRVKRRYGRSTFDRPGGQPLSLRGQPAEQSSRRPSPQGAGGRVAPTRESGECGAHRFGRPGGDALPGSGLVPPSWAGPLMPSPQGAGCRAVLTKGERGVWCTPLRQARPEFHRHGPGSVPPGWAVPTEADPSSVGGGGRAVHVGSR